LQQGLADWRLNAPHSRAPGRRQLFPKYVSAAGELPLGAALKVAALVRVRELLSARRARHRCKPARLDRLPLLRGLRVHGAAETRQKSDWRDTALQSLKACWVTQYDEGWKYSTTIVAVPCTNQSSTAIPPSPRSLHKAQPGRLI